jgi:hypothetical protein
MEGRDNMNKRRKKAVFTNDDTKRNPKARAERRHNTCYAIAVANRRAPGAVDGRKCCFGQWEEEGREKKDRAILARHV